MFTSRTRKNSTKTTNRVPARSFECLEDRTVRNASPLAIAPELPMAAFASHSTQTPTMTTNLRTDTAGSFIPANGVWHLRNSNSSGPADLAPFAYGAPGWIPIVGDWNGDGVDTIGVFDPRSATWYLRNSNTPGAADAGIVVYGAPGWIPVVGDWNGDGVDTIGVFDPRTATWYLRNSNTPGAADAGIVAYGAPGWIPVVGDWNGDAVDTLGVFDPRFATWYLRNSNTPGAANAGIFAYGGAGWIPVVGDWNGDGVDTIGVFDNAGTWYLRNQTTPGPADAGIFNFGFANWRPVAGAYQATTASIDDHYEDNDSFDRPANLGIISTSTSITDLALRDDDWFRFQIGPFPGQNASLTVRFQHASGDVDIALYDRFGQLLTNSTGTSNVELVSLAGGDANEYYLRVYGFNGATNPAYSIEINPDPIPDDRFEDNDAFAQTASLGTITSTAAFADLVLFDDDWFRFQLAQPAGSDASIVLRFQHSLGDIDVGLYNRSGLLLAASTSVNDTEVVSLAGLDSGEYVLRVYGYAGARNPSYRIEINPDIVTPGDDRFEDNDSFATAADLGTVTSTLDVLNLVMADTQDWFRFQLNSAGTASSFVTVTFQHSLGDIDVALFDAFGQQVAISDGVSNTEQISLNGLAAGHYYLRAYGFMGAANPSYAIRIEPGAVAPPPTAGTTLYLNFDGIVIANQDLRRWGQDWSIPFSNLDPEGDGIRVNPFLQGNADRERIINRILSNVQQDLNPFGITVVRHQGSAVENVGATTIFLGASTLPSPLVHVACDVDFGNNNRTDIAFVGNETWGSWENTALAMSDVVLHEAGHTYGLYHVNSLVNGVVYAESMGLRYTEQNSDLWLRDTAFLNMTFAEFQNHGGGRGPQNAYQTMLRNFGLAASPTADSVALVSVQNGGVLSITASAGADQIVIEEIGSSFQVAINGERFYLDAGFVEIRIFTEGDARDQVLFASPISQRTVLVDQAIGGDILHLAKTDGDLAHAHDHNDVLPHYSGPADFQSDPADAGFGPEWAGFIQPSTDEPVESSPLVETYSRTAFLQPNATFDREVVDDALACESATPPSWPSLDPAAPADEVVADAVFTNLDPDVLLGRALQAV